MDPAARARDGARQRLRSIGSGRRGEPGIASAEDTDSPSRIRDRRRPPQAERCTKNGGAATGGDFWLVNPGPAAVGRHRQRPSDRGQGLDAAGQELSAGTRPADVPAPAPALPAATVAAVASTAAAVPAAVPAAGCSAVPAVSATTAVSNISAALRRVALAPVPKPPRS